MGKLETLQTPHRETKEVLKRRLEFEKTIANVSARFVNFSDIDEAINASLAEVGRFSGADRVYVFLFGTDGTTMDNTHEWCAEGVSPQIDNLKDLPCEMFPWWMKKLQKGEIIHIEDVSKLPPEAKAEKEILQNQDIKSLLVLPLYVKGKLTGFIGFDDVTETGEWSEEDLLLLRTFSEIIGNAIGRKQMEDALLEQEAIYRAIFETTGTATVIVEEDTTISLVNREFERLTGYSKEELEGKKSWTEFFMQDDLEKMKRYHYLRRIDPDAAPRNYESRLIDKWGNIKDIFLTVAMIPGTKRSVGSFLDITNLKRTEEALIAEKERLRVTLHSIGDGVIATDTQGKIVLINCIAEKLVGWSQTRAIGKHINEVFHIVNEKTRRPEDPIEKAIKGGIGVDFTTDTILIAKDGTERIIEISGAPIQNRKGNTIGVVLVFRDITQRRKMETELARMQRLESIGILAGGIAHDFNNLLMAILGNISIAKLYAREDKAVASLKEAERACLTAKNLTQQLLTFSKGGAPIKKTTSIAELIKGAVGFALSGSSVKCEFFIPDDLWFADVDEGQISQVIQNLVINADQAMPKGGIIKVQAENVVVKQRDNLPLKEGKYVKISISDQGIGIAKEHIPKIFDPFFTTKQSGSGLGLATAYSIVKRHDGYITLESQVDVGTTFYIYLPASDKEIRIEEKKIDKLPKGKGRVLLMDDEEMVLEVVGNMLKYLGYKVEFAKDGSEAIKLYREAKAKGHPFDVVIMDLTIVGGMGGEETIKKLIAIDPEVKAIVSSGYANDPIMANFKKHGFSAVMTKPYNLKELSETLQKVIGE